MLFIGIDFGTIYDGPDMGSDLWENMESDPDAQARIKKAVELLGAQEGMTVLDIGCHKREAFNYLPDGVTYYGVNDTCLVPETITLNVDGGFDFPFQVDRILCLEVLEHLECPRGTLRDISRTLKDDGICVISLPNEATIFHRIRCLFGIVDQECFNAFGKHLHLPSLGQSKAFLSEFFKIESVEYYIGKQARAIRQVWVSFIIRLIPQKLLTLLANRAPSLFARGFIFKLVKKLP